MNTATNNANTETDISTELYPALAAYVSNGGSLKVSAKGGIWYVMVGDTAAVQVASRDLAYALRQADGVAKSWVLA
jgi:hypothetical protein